ncbi:MAG: hypothetical protein ACOYCE_06675 [Limnochordia bacterium]|jgi:hypothetical protein
MDSVTIVDLVAKNGPVQDFTPAALRELVDSDLVPGVHVKNVIVYGEHTGDRGVWDFTGVRLVDLIKYATGYEETMDNPLYAKRKGLYLACYAADGYSGILSWSELQFTPTGFQAMIAYKWEMAKAPNAGDIPNWAGDLILIVPTDTFTGAREIQALKTIELRHIGPPSL